MKKILDELRAIRKEKGISLRQMGEAIGKTGAHVGMLESGKTALRLEDFLAMCRVLEVSPALLLEGGGIGREAWRLMLEMKDLSAADFAVVAAVVASLRIRKGIEEK